MTEEAMLSMITRVSSKYSVKLSAQQIQSLIEGIKVKAAQQGSIFHPLTFDCNSDWAYIS